MQDLGRPGYYDVGIPLSGAMDRFALRAANLLVGNDEGAAALESCSWGRSCGSRPTRSSRSPAPNCRRSSMAWRNRPGPRFAVKAGQVLSFDYLRRGARAYMAVAGGIDVPVVLGSRSTYALGALGGLEGRALKAGDVLPIGEPARARRPGRTVPVELRRGAVPPATLRVMPGLY